MTTIPKDPVMLLGVVNTRLRDFYPSLEELCADCGLRRDEIVEKLKTIDYHYDSGRNQFV